MIICCAGCENPIMDKFLLTVLDRTWHADCVRCVDCGVLLTDKCFSREGKLFCRSDFFKRFGTKCSGCLLGISPQDLVRKARDRVFHLKCFTCCICRKQLSTGEELYVLDENRFICKHDYMSGKALADSFGAPSDDDEETLDVKPNIDTNTPNPTPPTSTTPSMTSPSSGHIPPAPLSHTSSMTPPVMHNSISSPGVGAPSTQTPSFAGLLGRTTPPGGLGLGISGNSVGTPLQDSLGVSFTDTPPSEKDGSSTFHESDVSDAEGSNEAKDSSTVEGSKLLDDDKGHITVDPVNVHEGQNPLPAPRAGSLHRKRTRPVANTDQLTRNGNKRRGPRTTIKAKQLEVLKSAFSATPKPTRHIREQLAKETGLPMRVIQVWFQNKRSKERRMKQLSSLGMRAHIFGNPRKLRGMRMSPSIEDGYPYYGDAFGYGPQGFHDFFPGQGQPPLPGMGFPHGLPPAMEQPLPPGGPMGDFPPLAGLGPPPISEGIFLSHHQELLSQRGSPDMILSHGGQGSFDHQANEGLVW